MSIKNFSHNQSEIIKNILDLHCPNGIEVDLTYGNGKFYDEIDPPMFCHDIQPLFDHVIKSDSGNLDYDDKVINSVMFDPPFLTYIKEGRKGNGDMVMANRFGGYWTYLQLKMHYTKSIIEISRILDYKGVLIFKCQDIVHNHKFHDTRGFVVSQCREFNLRLKDQFLLMANNRIGKSGKQKHSRIHNSYFLVFERVR